MLSLRPWWGWNWPGSKSRCWCWRKYFLFGWVHVRKPHPDFYSEILLLWPSSKRLSKVVFSFPSLREKNILLPDELEVMSCSVWLWFQSCRCLVHWDSDPEPLHSGRPDPAELCTGVWVVCWTVLWVDIWLYIVYVLSSSATPPQLFNSRTGLKSQHGHHCKAHQPNLLCMYGSLSSWWKFTLCL